MQVDITNKFFTNKYTCVFVFQMSQDADDKRTRTRSKGIRGERLLKTSDSIFMAYFNEFKDTESPFISLLISVPLELVGQEYR